MCGRYFIDQTVTEELHDLFQIVPQTGPPKDQDIHPSEKADVLVKIPQGIGVQKM